MTSIATLGAPIVSSPLSQLEPRVITKLAELAALESDWPETDVHATGPTATFGWTLAAAEALAGEQSLRMLAIYRAGSLVAVAPLSAARGRSWRALEILGLARLNEPADFIAVDRETLDGLVRAVARMNRPLLLGRTPADSPTIDSLQAACRGRAHVMIRPQAGCPYINLDASWNAPESHLSSGRRSDFRRAARRAEKRGELRAEVITPRPDEVDALLATAFEVEARSWKGAAGTALAADAVRGRHLRNFAHWASRAGILRIALLWIGGQPAAMQIATEQAGRFWLLKIGFDPEFADCSPGILLLAESLRYAAGRQLESFEFLGADEAWIRVWTDERRECVSVRVYPYGLRGAAAFGADVAIAACRRAADRWRTRRFTAHSTVTEFRNTKRDHMSKITGWMRQTAKSPFHALARRAAKSYLAGDTAGEALAIADALAARGIRSTIGYWDAVGAEPEAVFAAYDQAILELDAGNRGDRYLSIKFPSLGYSRELLQPLVEQAKMLALRLHFDSLGPESVDRTWDAVERAVGEGADLGVTIPARWRRSPDDADWAARLGLAVRVVKGQWADPGERRINPRRGYLNVIDRLAASKARAVAVATHDLTLAREALGRLRAAETPATLELLYGLPAQRQIALARELGVAVRMYLPYGAAYLPYCLAQFKRRPRIAWWLLRDALANRIRRSAAL